MMPFQQPMSGNLGTSLKPNNIGGRPKKVGQPTVLLDPGVPEGFSFSNGEPDAIKSAQEMYMNGGKNQGLPPGLAPKMLAQPLEQRRRKAISRGWAKRGKA